MTREKWNERWAKQCEEWRAICDEKIELGERPTAYQITLEQRKRALARGERLVTYQDFLEAHS